MTSSVPWRSPRSGDAPLDRAVGIGYPKNVRVVFGSLPSDVKGNSWTRSAKGERTGVTPSPATFKQDFGELLARIVEQRSRRALEMSLEEGERHVVQYHVRAVRIDRADQSGPPGQWRQ